MCLGVTYPVLRLRHTLFSHRGIYDSTRDIETFGLVGGHGVDVLSPRLQGRPKNSHEALGNDLPIQVVKYHTLQRPLESWRLTYA
jgi:hypothetical protein